MSDSTCANCGTALGGDYCHVCGQKRAHLRLGLHDFGHEVFHEFAHFDGKILRTLQYLFTRPGFLTREFVEGRRVRYITPVRLYLLMVALFSIVFALLGAKADIVQIHSGPAPAGMTKVRTTTAMTRTMEHGARKFENDPEKLGESIAHAIPKAMFVLMPLFAVLVMLFERRRERFYIPHLYFSIHYHAFAFAWFALVTVIGTPQITALRLAAKLLVFVVPLYLYFALRRTYDDSRAMALVKTLAISVVYLFVVSLAMVAIMLIEFRMA